MDSTLLSGCYAFPPNSHGYCGRNSFVKVLQTCLNKAKSTKNLETELKKFKAQYAYLSLIARENNLKPFDSKVVSAFWIGNSLLENVSHKALQFLMNDLFPKNPVRGKFLAENLPEGLVPHHSFNALYVNFVTEKVDRTITNFDSCCVTSGKILSISGKKAKINRFSISKHDDFIINKKISTIDLVRNGVQLVTKPQNGDIIAVHWGMAVDKLSKKNENLLLKYTQKNIDVLNGNLRS